MSLEEDLRFDDREYKNQVAKKRHVLTPKAKMTCEYYLRGMSAREAMLKAGYAESYCCDQRNVARFLKTRTVIAYLRGRQEEIAEAESIDKSKLIKYAQHILKDDDNKDRTKALELLMRMTQPFDPSHTSKEDTKPITLTINVAEKPKDA